MLVGLVDRFRLAPGHKGGVALMGSRVTRAPACLKFKSGNDVHPGFGSSPMMLLIDTTVCLVVIRLNRVRSQKRSE
jgi:hypothetical protein